MQYLERWLLYYECGVCDYWHRDVLGIYKACGDEVAGVAVEGVEVGEWGEELRVGGGVCRYRVTLK